MKAALVVGMMVAGLVLAGPASASQELAKSGGCLGCHDVEKKKMGPAFKEVAANHKGKADAAGLAAKISGGKDHPKVKASEEDVKKLVQWVLAM